MARGGRLLQLTAAISLLSAEALEGLSAPLPSAVPTHTWM